MALANDTLSTKAMGGTELLKHELVRRINEASPDLLDHFQIFVSRVHEPIDKSKIVLYWLHDLAQDPAAANELKNGGWRRFDFLVFVSNWQMQQYASIHGIPYSRSIVMDNCIVPFDRDEVDKDYSSTIRLIYTPTPHRGLEILVPVFEEIYKNYDQNIQLDVFSSFNLYGWPDRDKQYEELFEKCRTHPAINYHGSVPNERVREALKQAHIFAYPSIWQETSCLCLMEAMSARTMCVHPNLAALPDTGGSVTAMYQWTENPNEHAQRFMMMLQHSIKILRDTNPSQIAATKMSLDFQKVYADGRFNWAERENTWLNFLQSMANMKQTIFDARVPQSGMFSVRTT